MKIDDIVTFGEKSLKGKVIGFTKKDGLDNVKVLIEELINNKLWKWVYVFPCVQARLDEVEVDMDFDTMSESDRETYLKTNKM